MTDHPVTFNELLLLERMRRKWKRRSGRRETKRFKRELAFVLGLVCVVVSAVLIAKNVRSIEVRIETPPEQVIRATERQP